MGIHERKEREKHEKRRLILDTAMQLFIDEGYENVSIRKIAEKIEYSPATIYLYFRDKDEIYHNLQQEGFKIFLEALSRSEAVEDPMERVIDLGHRYIRFGIENPEYYDLMFISRSPMKKVDGPKDWKDGIESYLVLFRTAQFAIDNDKFTESDATAVASGLWSMVHGLVSLVNRGRIDMGEQEGKADKVIKVFDNFVKGFF